MQKKNIIKHKVNKDRQNNKGSLFSNNIYLKTYLLGLGLSFLFIPFFAYAATTYSQDLFGIFEYIKDIIDDIVLWLFTTGAVLVFLFFLAKKVLEMRSGKVDISGTNKYILYGLITLTLMFTFYAVIGLIAVTFGIRIGIPQFFKTQDGLSPGSGNVQRSYSVIGR
jgi:Na+-transporting methylmalonyl-CoA/oxaloacetate decarboxylase gamma subunit